MLHGRKLLRSLQVFFPFLQDARFHLQRTLHRLRGRPVEADFAALRLLPWAPGALFLDVGANRGQSIEAMRILVPQARILAFEPNPRLCARLARLYRDDPRIGCMSCALGDVAGGLTLWVPIYRGWTFDGLASLDRTAAAGWLGPDRLYLFRPDWLRVEEIACAVRRLDDLDLAPAFIKLDVQGFEPQVLAGGEATLRRHRPVLMLESPRVDREIPFLERLGYTFYAFDGERLVPDRLGRVNSFFLTEDKAALLSR
jgi:FkbM family methyltransferase